MVSQLAIDDIKGLMEEGFVVQPEDVIRLNALGLKITEDPECEMSLLPRVASIEGVQFRQPSVAKDIFLDECYRLLCRDDSTMLGYEAYVLSHDVQEDELKHPVKFAFKVGYWMKKTFKKTTANELRRVVDYCLYGIDETTGEFPVMMIDEGADSDEDKVGGDKSWALYNYLKSASVGIDTVSALRATSPQLSAMIERAYIIRGLPLKKNEKKATAEYYSTLNSIKEKMKKQQEVQNG